MGKGDGGAADTSGAEARAEEERRKSAAREEVSNIESIFSSFNPDYWASQTTDLEERYDPQIDTAFSSAKGNLLKDLATKGHGKESSIYQQGLGKLNRESDVVRENLASSIMSAISDAQGDVLSRKQNLINTVNAASDPSGAGAGAGAVAQSLRSPVTSGFDVSGAFSDYKNMRTISDILEGTDRAAPGVKLFGGRTSAGKVVK